MAARGRRNSNRHHHQFTTSPSGTFLDRPTGNCGNKAKGVDPGLFNGMNLQAKLCESKVGPELCLKGNRNDANINTGGLPMGPSCVLRIEPNEKKAQSNLSHGRRLRRETSFGRVHSNWVTFRTVDEIDQELFELRNKTKVALDSAWFVLKKEKELVSGHISRVTLLENSLRELRRHGEKDDEVEYRSAKQDLNVQQHGILVQNDFFKKLLEQTRKAQNIFNPSMLSLVSINLSVSGSNNAAESDEPWHRRCSLMNIGRKFSNFRCNVERSVHLKERLVALRDSRQDTLSELKEKLQLIESHISALEEKKTVQENSRYQLLWDCSSLKSLKEDERMRSRAEKEELKKQLMVLSSTVHRKQARLVCMNII